MASMAGMSASPFLLELNSLAAMAQQGSPSDYKALVCIFLAGGNDGHGTVIATDAAILQRIYDGTVRCAGTCL